mgnify:CR=1 FL=1
MSDIKETKKMITDGAFDSALVRVYGEKELDVQRARYAELCTLFEDNPLKKLLCNYRRFLRRMPPRQGL